MNNNPNNSHNHHNNQNTHYKHSKSSDFNPQDFARSEKEIEAIAKALHLASQPDSSKENDNNNELNANLMSTQIIKNSVLHKPNKANNQSSSHSIQTNTDNEEGNIYITNCQL